jgi:hypothetical protein
MRVSALVLCMMAGLAGLGLIGGACATEGQVESTPKSITQSEQTQEEELPQDVTWTTVEDEEGSFSISVPSEWETHIDIEELSTASPGLVELGIAPFLMSVDTETGSNLLILVDGQHMFADEPIDVEAYIQFQIEDLKQKPGISGLSAHAVTIDGIKGTQIRFTAEQGGVEWKGQTNILIGNEDDPGMLCGYIALLVQGSYFSDAQLSVIEKAMQSLRILPTASGGIEC